MVVFQKDNSVYRSYVYDCYKEYCEIFGLDQENNKKFTQRLKETRGISQCKKDQERAWRGIALKTLTEYGEILDLTERKRTDRTYRTDSPPSDKSQQELELGESSERVPCFPRVLDNADSEDYPEQGEPS